MEWQKKVYEPPTMGIQDRLSPIMCDVKEAPVLENFEVNYRGILDKYKGFTKSVSAFPDHADSFIRLLLNLKRSISSDIILMAALDNGNTNATYKVDLKATTGDGTSYYIGHTAGTNASFTNANTAVTGVGTTWLSHLKAGDKIKATSHADSAYTEIVSVNSDTSLTLKAGGYLGATLATTAYTARIILNTFYNPRGTIFNNKAIITNGVDAVVTYDTVTANLIVDANCPKARYIEPHKNRVFMANTGANPSRVFWSNVNDEQTWDATSFEDVFPQDNGAICSIKSFADSLVVLKDNGNIYQIYGNFDTSQEGEPDYIRKVDVTENIGIISQKTPVIHNNFLYFMSQGGIYRLDNRGYVEKVSFQVNNFIDGSHTTIGTSQAKYYPYDTKTQWDTGLYRDESSSGSPITSRATTGGTIQAFSDRYSEIEVSPTSDRYAVALSTDGTLHYAWSDSLVGNELNYKRISPSGTILEEVAVSKPVGAYSAINIAVNSSGDVAIIYDGVNCIERIFSTGVWTVQSPPGAVGSYAILAYDIGTPTTLYLYSGSSNFSRRISGVWDYINVNPVSPNAMPQNIFIDSTGNIYLTPNVGASALAYDLSTNGGVTWSRTFTGKSLTGKAMACQESTGNHVIYYQGTDYKVKKYVIETTTETNVVTLSSSDVYLGATSMWGDIPLVAYTKRDGASYNTETILYGSTTISNTTLSEFQTTVISTGQFAFTKGIIATAAMSRNDLYYGVLLLRRFSPVSYYTGPQTSDATLSAWQTYDVIGEATNGNTILHQIGVSTTSPVSSYSTITSGSIIGSDPTKIYVKFKITMTLITFNVPEVGAVIINYLGTGVDAKEPTAISFKNELYFPVSYGITTANNKVLIIDIGDKYVSTTWPIGAMCVFKDSLYGASSTKGDLLHLKQGYSQDGAAYSSDFTSKEDFLGSIDLEKDINKIYVLYEVKDSGTMSFSYRLDNYKDSSGSTWKTTTIDMTQNGFYEILVGNKARTIQFRCQDANLGGQCALLGWVLTFRNLNQR